VVCRTGPPLLHAEREELLALARIADRVAVLVET
jgi:hypothetical protein